MTARKICLMGDSHSGALKRGWSRIHGDYPEIEIVFFAGGNPEWHGLHARDGRLVAQSAPLREKFRRSANGVEEISAGFDAYILCGLKLAILLPLGFWCSGAYSDWETYRAAVATFVRQSGCAHVLGELRTITAAPVLIAAAPFQPKAYCKSSPSLDDETGSKLRAVFESACEALAAERDAIFVPQPAQTVARNQVTTKMKFAAAPRGTPREDTRHCNEDYGAIALANMLRHAAEEIRRRAG